MRSAQTLLLLPLLLSFTACLGADDPVGADGAAVAISVAALDLDDVENVRYTLSVANESGVPVWTRQVDADSHGDGAGSHSYVGPCDASDDPDGDGDAENTVSLVLDEVIDTTGTLTAGVDYQNPAPTSAPLARVVVCRQNADTAVSFDLTVARRAEQGFFDVAVTFDDIFCSAKLDCLDDDGQPLDLLFDGATRDRTVVLGFACTAGAGADTHLYMTPVEIDCGGAGRVALALQEPGGNKGAVDPIVFQHALFFGAEALESGGTSWGKRYWNLAIGIDETALSATDPCVLSAAGTASNEPFVQGRPPAGATYPRIAWNVTLNSLGSAVVDCGTHAVDEAGSGVATDYAQDPTFLYEMHAPSAGAYARATDAYASCAEIKQANPLLTGVGLYAIHNGSEAVEVLCDMSTSGGGWTLIAAQFEDDPVEWAEGRQADYDPSLRTARSFTLTGADLVGHDQLAFGRAMSTGASTWDSEILDHVALAYDPALSYGQTVSGLSTGLTYGLHRNPANYHNGHNPEEVPVATSDSAGGSWKGTLTFDQAGGRGFNWAFSPHWGSPEARGFAYGGYRRAAAADAFAWTLWARDSTGFLPDPPVALYPSCKAMKDAIPGLTGKGVYTIQPVGSDPLKVLCDHDTFGGGWTLVAAQFDSNPIAWNEGRQLNYDPSVSSSRESFALTGVHLPARTQVAFGRIGPAGAVPDSWSVETLDYFTFTYTTGNLHPRTLVTGASASYYIHRNTAGHYANHNPEMSYWSDPNADFNDTLTIEEVGPRDYSFAFSRKRGVATQRGYSFGGVGYTTVMSDEAWVVWVR